MSLTQFSTGELIDWSIVGVYLLAVLVIGVYFGRKVDTLQGYAIGNRNYVTTTLVMALFATIIGGGSVIGGAEKAFTVGITYTAICLGFPIGNWITARYLASHMGRFLERDTISVGEMMASAYGKPGQVITGAAGALRCVTALGAQIGALGWVSHYLLGIPQVWAIVFAGGLTAAYSAFGGIRAVTATDSMQFIILVCALPLLCHYGVYKLGGMDGYDVLWQSVPKENLTLFPTWASFATYFPWFLIFCIPILTPGNTQRLLMAKDTTQAFQVSRIVAAIGVPFYLLVGLVGLIALAFKSDLEPNLALPYLVKAILPSGMKGFVVAGLLATFMSTADSLLNSASIAVVHDVVQPLRKQPLDAKDELRWTKITAFGLGFVAISFPLLLKSLVDIILASFLTWHPIVVVPLIAAIRGHRSSIRSFLIAAGAGVVTLQLWPPLFGKLISIPVVMPALIANGLAFWIARKFDTHENIFIPEWEKSTPWFKDWEEKRALLKKQEQKKQSQ